MQDRGLKFAGTVYARLKGSTTWFELGNTRSLTIKSSTEKDERISFKKESFGQALDNLPTPKPPEISWENDTFNKRNFGFMLMGKATDLDTQLKTVSGETITLVKGEWVELANANLDGNKDITLTLTAGGEVKKEDYTVNHNVGLIMLHADSESEAGEATISYTTREGGGFAISAATLDSLNLELKIDGKNRVTDENGLLNVWEVNVAADGDFDWLSGDWGKAKFSGTCITPSGKTEPYHLKMFAANPS
ncbi:hypothetical protein [Wielerella bovis]|uniref:phage tail tube protein n=1 Tax=Wielerella bovis TaxID=2917790 RepID=UPI0020191E94|nr:hypothetical protein [Wielerella bovis]MCG7655943.1 hypothetical protein [Wielerella bovis]MCG7655966.1 hypothetical protein [Wielerella bovis]MCG7658140.1 hypothetical protein [Wielerella bovis]MCG7658191.1 hypothetical protein [Wielerella bovis]ULJ63285.1 hypothetical protein MIS46_04340 [Wielerella bovis]